MILHLDEQQTATYTGNNTSIGFVKNNKYNVIQDLDTKKPSMTIFNKNQINININDDKINYYLK